MNSVNVRNFEPMSLQFLASKTLCLKVTSTRFGVIDLFREKLIPKKVAKELWHTWNIINWGFSNQKPLTLYRPDILIRKRPFVCGVQLSPEIAKSLFTSDLLTVIKYPPYCDSLIITVNKKFWIDRAGERYCCNCRKVRQALLPDTKLFRTRYMKHERFSRQAILMWLREKKRYCAFCFLTPLFEIYSDVLFPHRCSPAYSESDNQYYSDSSDVMDTDTDRDDED